MALSTIVVAFDFSPTSRLAVARARDLCLRRGARLVLAHAFAPISSSRIDLSLLPPAFEAESLKATRQALEEEAAVLADGIEVQPVVERGLPSTTIVEIAEDHRAELIVTGSRGLGGFDHAMLGSTAESVVGHAPCPVLVIRENDESPLAPPSRVLVPTDLSSDVEPVADALEKVFGTRDQAGDPLHVIVAHADRVPPLLQPALRTLTGVQLLPFEQVKEKLAERLEPTAAGLRERGFHASVDVCEGEPASRMIETARHHGVDLIAIATRGRSGLSRALLGSVARRVVQHAPCPILTVPRGK